MIQLLLVKGEGCSFCNEKRTMFSIQSDTVLGSHVRLCRWCAEKLALALNSIRWTAQE